MRATHEPETIAPEQARSRVVLPAWLLPGVLARVRQRCMLATACSAGPCRPAGLLNEVKRDCSGQHMQACKMCWPAAHCTPVLQKGADSMQLAVSALCLAGHCTAPCHVKPDGGQSHLRGPLPLLLSWLAIVVVAPCLPPAQRGWLPLTRLGQQLQLA